VQAADSATRYRARTGDRRAGTVTLLPIDLAAIPAEALGAGVARWPTQSAAFREAPDRRGRDIRRRLDRSPRSIVASSRVGRLTSRVGRGGAGGPVPHSADVTRRARLENRAEQGARLPFPL